MYYVVYPILYLFSLLPFRVLHLLSDAIYQVLYYLVRYRRDVVMQNLEIAFPEKTHEERIRIAKDFYHQFLDNFIETIKLLSISKKTLDKHFAGEYEIMNDLYAKGYKVQVHLGHFFNWEFANAAYAANTDAPFLVVYMPIASKAVNRVFMKLRSRFGSNLIAATKFKKEFTPYAREQYSLVLVGDQNPGGPDKAYWTSFFGRLTPFVKGPEKGARFNNTAVVMCNIIPGKKRGYYTAKMELLTTDPRSLPDGEITRKMISFIEDSVRKHPSNYLWSHRRWKWEYVAEQHAKLVV
jgi:KDO2-lipid IV(A) lauroyltransferase